MIEEIITYLREKTSLKYCFQSVNVNDLPGVAYTYSDNGSNKIKKDVRLELHIITKGTTESSIKTSEAMKAEINSVLLTLGDRPLTKNILSVKQNGGGILTNTNTDTIHQFLYYDIIYREKR